MEPRKVGQQMASATFKFQPVHLGWIERRARALGMNKSAYVRWLIEQDMDEPAPRPIVIVADQELAEVAS